MHNKKLPILPGEYNISLACFINAEISDEIRYALKISIIEGDYFGTGRIPIVKEGCITEHDWITNTN